MDPYFAMPYRKSPNYATHPQMKGAGLTRPILQFIQSALRFSKKALTPSWASSPFQHATSSLMV